MALDKLKFWKKKEDDLFIDDDLKKPIEGVDDSFTHSPSSSPPPLDTGFSNPSMQRDSLKAKTDFTVRETSKPVFSKQQVHGNDELMLAKLDAIKAMVENISRRLERIEEIALEEQRKQY